MFRYTKIILSGLKCVGKTSLFWDLQKRLNWPTFSASQFLRDYIRNHQLSAADLEAHEAKMGQEIDQRIEDLLNHPYPVLIEARVFGGIIKPWPGTLRLLLEAKDQVRFQRSAGREGIDMAKAEKRLQKREGKWLQTMHERYGLENFYNHDYYDWVIDTSQLSKEQVVEMVLNKVKT